RPRWSMSMQVGLAQVESRTVGLLGSSGFFLRGTAPVCSEAHSLISRPSTTVKVDSHFSGGTCAAATEGRHRTTHRESKRRQDMARLDSGKERRWVATTTGSV